MTVVDHFGGRLTLHQVGEPRFCLRSNNGNRQHGVFRSRLRAGGAQSADQRSPRKRFVPRDGLSSYDAAVVVVVVDGDWAA